MSKLVLERNGSEVFYNGKKLTVVEQATKGPGKEVVKVSDCPEANGQKWVSLSRLKEGINEIECKAREVSTAIMRYSLTPEELLEVQGYEARIAEIKEKARKRKEAEPNLKIDPTKLTEEERLAEMEKFKKFLGL